MNAIQLIRQRQPGQSWKAFCELHGKAPYWLHCSDLRGSDLRGSDLRGSDLREADLREAD